MSFSCFNRYFVPFRIWYLKNQMVHHHVHSCFRHDMFSLHVLRSIWFYASHNRNRGKCAAFFFESFQFFADVIKSFLSTLVFIDKKCKSCSKVRIRNPISCKYWEVKFCIYLFSKMKSWHHMMKFINNDIIVKTCPVLFHAYWWDAPG